jgi:acylphosphatase
MRKEVRCRVTGRVQLVMFRDYARRKANLLKIDGTVKNMSDGSVEIVAQGEESWLKRFVEFLRKGPVLAKVDHVSVEWRDPTEEMEGFRIIR